MSDYTFFKDKITQFTETESELCAMYQLEEQNKNKAKSAGTHALRINSESVPAERIYYKMFASPFY